MEKDEDLGPEQKQFFALSERCQQMFHGLRDLGSFGRGYQPYFQKTFEVYTRLWKFQQNYRGPLEAAGLKRWEIGDIASHIGQIYYHYYLRTSDRSYLAESSVFYEAIQQRKYFQELTSSSLTEDWRRLLRYYARYIVVCLLQQRFEQVSAVSTNLHKYVQQYINMLSPPDAQEWLAVVRELRVFFHACLPAFPSCTIIPGDFVAPSPIFEGSVLLQQIVLVACQTHQIKFSELTLDVLRMMRVLEKDPPSASSSLSSANATSGRNALKTSAIAVGGLGGTSGSKNPAKHLLYRPTLSGVLSHLHGAVKELTGNGAMMLYVCADAVVSNAEDKIWGGGAQMCGSRSSDTNGLCPGDVMSLTRRPLFFVCEGESSALFSSLRSPFGLPCVALLSPSKYPAGCERQRLVVSPTFSVEKRGSGEDGAEFFGNLFTLFLTDPVTAIARLCKVNAEQYSESRMARCKGAVVDCLRHTLTFTALNDKVPMAWKSFLSDEFCSLLIAKFALCRAVLCKSQHVPRSPAYLPKCSPELPSEADPPSDLLDELMEAFKIKTL